MQHQVHVRRAVRQQLRPVEHGALVHGLLLLVERGTALGLPARDLRVGRPARSHTRRGVLHDAPVWLAARQAPAGLRCSPLWRCSGTGVPRKVSALSPSHAWKGSGASGRRELRLARRHHRDVRGAHRHLFRSAFAGPFLPCRRERREEEHHFEESKRWVLAPRTLQRAARAVRLLLAVAHGAPGFGEAARALAQRAMSCTHTAFPAISLHTGAAPSYRPGLDSVPCAARDREPQRRCLIAGPRSRSGVWNARSFVEEHHALRSPDGACALTRTSRKQEPHARAPQVQVPASC